jgi:4-amino-4-deoxy-L-arabinose transferase-like glycosyltransferase
MKSIAKIQFIHLLAIGILLRILWILAIDVIPISDSSIYKEFATSIANGNGYAYADGSLTAYWPVGPSALYAIGLKVFGDSELASVIPNILSGILIIVFSYLVALRHFDKPTAIAAAGILAFWPVLIQFSTVFASELHFCALIMWCIYALFTLEKRPALQGLHWGSVLALACYMRPTAMPFFIVFPVLLFLKNSNLRATFISSLIAITVAFALIAPWAQRNKELLGEYVPISANFGSNLWMGNNPTSDGGYSSLPSLTFKNELERDNYYKDIAKNFILENPLQYVYLSTKRAINTYGRETIGVVWNEQGLEQHVGKRGVFIAKIISSLYWITAFAASLLAFWIIIRKKALPIYSPLVVTPAVFFVIPILTVSQDRYHMALIPFVAIFAAFLLVNLQSSIIQRASEST